jgi:hypothetical protein
MTIHPMPTGLCLYLTTDDLALLGLTPPLTVEEALYLTHAVCRQAGFPPLGPVELEEYQSREGLLLFARLRPGTNYRRRPWPGPYPRRRRLPG